MKNLALVLTFGAALGAPLAASAAMPHAIASLPATTFSIADIGWEEDPLEELRAALDLVDMKPAGHAPIVRGQSKPDAAAQKPAAQTLPVASGPVPSAAKTQDAAGEFLVAQFLVSADSAFLGWR